jgi:hypothetical protein
MNWAKYFEETAGTGILGTADPSGEVDLAIYARPHVIEDDTIAFIMRPRLTHQNLRTTTKAAYMFIEAGPGYKGYRFYLTKIREESDAKVIAEMRRMHKHSQTWRQETEEAYIVYFRIHETRPLVGDNPI